MLKYVALFDTEALPSGDRQVGIAAIDGAEQLDHIADIAPDAEEVERLAARLNQSAVSLIHFREVVEDYIVSRL